MPRRLFPATPSKLASFADCPRRYRYAYVDRPTPPKGPAWAHNGVGAAVHAALRSWWDLPVERRTTGAARQLLYAAWSRSGFRDAEQAERWRAGGGLAVDYVATLTRPTSRWATSARSGPRPSGWRCPGGWTASTSAATSW